MILSPKAFQEFAEKPEGKKKKETESDDTTNVSILTIEGIIFKPTMSYTKTRKHSSSNEGGKQLEPLQGSGIYW